MPQLFDVVRARLQAEPRPARPSVRLKPLLAAVSTGVLFVKAPPRAEAAPVNTSPPAISGVLEPEHTLTATLGTWKDATSPIVRYDYQCLRCNQYECTDIDYQTSSTFVLPWEMLGAQTEVTVIATDAEGEVGIATSEETNVVTYNAPSYTLSETVSGSGFVAGAEVGAPNAALACPGACGAGNRYRPGTTIQLTATPAPGATFEGWQGACAGIAPTCSVTLGGDEAVTAVFTTTTPTPVLPTGSEPRAAEAPLAGAPSGSTPAATSHTARLLGLRALRHRIQASVQCLQAKPCRLSLGLFARTSAAQLLIAKPLPERYGKARYGHGEGFHGALVTRFGLLREKAWYRDRRQAERDVTQVFCAMHSIAKHQRRLAAHGAPGAPLTGASGPPPPLARAA